MAMMTQAVQARVRSALAEMTAPVKLILFTRRGDGTPGCESCDDTEQLAEELAALSGGKLGLEVRDIVQDRDAAAAYGVDKVPALVVLRGGPEPHDYGIRFYGVPSGYEFGTLIEDLKLVSRGATDLTTSTLEALARLKQPAHLQVYVTPTCPYCPAAVLLAHKLALASEHITADMVEASEFPELADRYNVYGVPRTIINDAVHIEGAVPEEVLVSNLLAALDGSRIAPEVH